jgi:hypothetical protein
MHYRLPLGIKLSSMEYQMRDFRGSSFCAYDMDDKVCIGTTRHDVKASSAASGLACVLREPQLRATLSVRLPHQNDHIIHRVCRGK